MSCCINNIYNSVKTWLRITSLDNAVALDFYNMYLISVAKKDIDKEDIKKIKYNSIYRQHGDSR